MNPAFAIVEAFWIISGRSDARILNFWNPTLPAFCGNLKEYPGAYGFRLKHGFGIDQIYSAYDALRNNKSTRQVVLQIWDARRDLPKAYGEPSSTDIPCNVCALLTIRDDKLEWMEIMRSNDIFRGTPYNFVQFTILQEILSGWLGLNIGSYNHMSNSLHMYESDATVMKIQANPDIAMPQSEISLSKDVFDNILPLVMNAFDMLSSPSISEDEFDALCAAPALPRAYRDMILVAAADSARRRNWGDRMNRAADACEDPALCLAWRNWAQRNTSTYSKS